MQNVAIRKISYAAFSRHQANSTDCLRSLIMRQPLQNVWLLHVEICLTQRPRFFADTSGFALLGVLLVLPLFEYTENHKFRNRKFACYGGDTKGKEARC
jgi:hypothetical protein